MEDGLENTKLRIIFHCAAVLKFFKKKIISVHSVDVFMDKGIHVLLFM